MTEGVCPRPVVRARRRIEDLLRRGASCSLLIVAACSGSEADPLVDEPVETPEEPAPSGPPIWSFIAPSRPAEPAVAGAAWVANPIDAFVLAKLEEAGIDPEPRAAPH